MASATCARFGLAAILILTVTSAARGASASLAEAVREGDNAAVRSLLARRVDVNASEADGTTPLHWAVRTDDMGMVDALLRAGARADVATRLGVTPLSLAAVNGSAPMIGRLLKAGARATETLADGETVLMRAARTGRADAVRVLLEGGADPNARERVLGETALMWAAAENHAGTVAVLASHGASLDARSTTRSDEEFRTLRRVRGVVTRGGWTPLMYAARQGSGDAVRALAKAGAALDARTPEGTTPLVLAIINAHYDVAGLLVDLGAKPDVADDSGMGALYAAVDMHTVPWMKGRPASKTSDSTDALTLAARLLKAGADPNATLRAPMLRRHQTNGDRALGNGATPLMRAAKSGDVAMMTVLLEHGADPFRIQTDTGVNALMMAAGFGWRSGDTDANDRGTEQEAIDAIALCLSLGLDVNAIDYKGQTALHIAIERGDEVVRYLASKGARLDLKDYEDRTPLDVASRENNAAEVRGAFARPTTAALLRELVAAAPAR